MPEVLHRAKWICVYYRKPVAFLLYVDDGIFVAPKEEDIEEAFQLLSKGFTDSNGKVYRAYKMTNEGSLAEYLGVRIQELRNGTIKLSQPQLIASILAYLGLAKCSPATTPAVASRRLHRDLQGKLHNDKLWHYRSLISKVNILE